MPIRVVNDCAERFLVLVADCHIHRIIRSEQKFRLYQAVTNLRSRMKKIGKKGLSIKKFIARTPLF